MIDGLKMKPFSVLMSVYEKEKGEFLNRALLSIYDEQIIKPNQIVLVEDGPLNDELYAVIRLWQEKLPEIFTSVPLKKNVGLGDALASGMTHCQNDLIARMDSDDVAMPNRFQKQLEIFHQMEIDVCGATIGEFEYDEQQIDGYRKTPQHHDDIVQFAKSRNPINHPVVMFKKSAVLKAGNYQKALWMEDYFLWVRMILDGARFYNIPEMLLKMRAGKGQLLRRSGLKYAVNEFKTGWKFHQMGFLSLGEFVRVFIPKFMARILPKKMLAFVYTKMRSSF